MIQPSSRHLSHDYEAYKGLSLRELFWIVIFITPLTSLFLALIGLGVNFPLAFGGIGFLVGFILSITLFPKRIARIKRGKPKGYVMKKARLLLVRLRLLPSPYLHYQGLWKKAKTVGEVYV